MSIESYVIGVDTAVGPVRVAGRLVVEMVSDDDSLTATDATAMSMAQSLYEQIERAIHAEIANFRAGLNAPSSSV